jgi:hypothetical protein
MAETETETETDTYVYWTAPDDQKIDFIRRDRNEKLLESDKYVLPDFPITEEKREEWRIYRQALRDFTINISVSDIVVDNTLTVHGCNWPTPPSP